MWCNAELGEIRRFNGGWTELNSYAGWAEKRLCFTWCTVMKWPGTTLRWKARSEWAKSSTSFHFHSRRSSKTSPIDQVLQNISQSTDAGQEEYVLAHVLMQSPDALCRSYNSTSCILPFWFCKQWQRMRQLSCWQSQQPTQTIARKRETRIQLERRRALKNLRHGR